MLVLNLGLRSIRAIVFDSSGNKLAHHWLPVKTYIEDDKVEQDPNEWWSLARRVLDETLSNQEIKDNLGYVTVTSSSCNLILLDENKQVLSPSLMVSDKRAVEQAKRLAEQENLQYIFNGHNILSVPSYMIPKMLWLKEKNPSLFARTRHFISSDSFLLMKLSGGGIVTDPLNAEKSFYLLDEKKYPNEVLSLLGIDESYLAPVREVGTHVGNLSEEIKTEFGISGDVKIIQTTYDALAAFWGTGAFDEGDACVVCGTCSSIRVYSNNGLQEKKGGLFSQYFNHNNSFVVGGSNNLAGGLLEWAKYTFYKDVYSRNDDYVFRLMENEANKSSLGAKGLLFLPYLIGERTPFFDPDVRGMFFGLGRGHSRKEIIRSIFEAISFLSLDLVNFMEEGGVPVRRLRMSGGLGKNELICRIKADITGKEVLLLNEVETTALGCFMLLATSVGNNVDKEKLRNLVKVDKTFYPVMENHQKYKKLYELFKKLYRDNKDNFKYRNELLKLINEDRKHEIKNL